MSEIVSLISVIIALVAVCLSVWQARASTLNAVHSRSLPILTDSISQFRSPEFRESVRRLTQSQPNAVGDGGFESLPDSLREDAYKVCYYFDLIGSLVAHGIIREDIVVGHLGSQVMRVWLAMAPAIESERAHRYKTYPADVSPGFLIYYEHLVARIQEMGGQNSASALQRRIGVRRLPPISGI